MKWLSLVPYVLERLPIERMFVRPVSNKERLRELQDVLEHSSAKKTEAVESQTANNPDYEEVPESLSDTEEDATLISGPTTEETVLHLKGRLARFLSDFEDDLLDGGRIMGKPCDCLEKHSGKISGVCLELSSMDNDPVYSDVVNWLEAHEEPFRLVNVADNPPEFYRAMVPEIRKFRKHIKGTEPPRRDSREERFRRFAEQRGITKL